MALVTPDTWGSVCRGCHSAIHTGQITRQEVERVMTARHGFTYEGAA